ncbi:MAG: carboxypeptidase regulatory-like domain-containing protein [Pyrinomonadaceae bacterium]|nr:carboxypeptidase regulatory-like domain-containing protein [Pyrinomonadaceae bacterium]
MTFAETRSGASIVGLALLVLTANFTAQSQTEESPAAPTTGTISGRVVTDTGQPVHAATVTLRGSTPFFQPRVTTTDAEGNFQIDALSAELYGVSAFAPGYISLPRDQDSLPVYYRIGDAVDVTMVKGGVITGSVMSSAGDPVVQMAVRAILILDAGGRPSRFPQNNISRATDDRGVYRLYGLTPGTYLVSAGGRAAFGPSSGAFESDVAIYAPSSTRDTASEIVVRAGDETTGVDIRYRSEAGHVITGVVVGPIDPTGISQPNINLTQVSNGIPMGTAYSYQLPNSKGFSFYGVSDGDYDLVAQLSLGPGELLLSEPHRVTVKGADRSGIELTVKPLASIGGRLTLESSTAPECKNKRRPLFTEILVGARRSEKGVEKGQPRPFAFVAAQGSPNTSGDFLLRNLSSGQYNFGTRFFAKYWYLRSIARDAPTGRPPAVKTSPSGRTLDMARNGLSLKSGERVSGLIVTLAEGAASLRGTIKLAPGEKVPPKLYVHLVPGEKENADDVLRVFAAPVNADGTFALNNLAPGSYWALARIAGENESLLDLRVRLAEEGELRLQIRRAAEVAKTVVEFKPCQNITDYQLPITIAPR